MATLGMATEVLSPVVEMPAHGAEAEALGATTGTAALSKATEEIGNAAKTAMLGAAAEATALGTAAEA